jgi:formiminoglutamate deiminase
VTAYVCELAWLGGERPQADVVVEIEGERFARVEPGGTPPAEAERLAGLALPGFANAHSHAFQRALRARTEAARGSFWTWREEMYRLAARLDPDSYQALARATFAEMALAGITVVGEFHYLHHGPDGTPYEDPNEIGRRLVEAAREAGIRITLLDACYLEAGPGEPLVGAQRRFGDGDAARWAERVDAFGDPGPGARLGAAIHSVRAVGPQAAALVAEWAAARAVPLHAHVSEQPRENELCLEAHGRTPTALLAEAGAVSERFTAVHFTHVTAPDRKTLGDAGATACLCPTTERDLADGIASARAIADAGAALALGTDSHSLIDPFEEMRAVELDERLASGSRGHHSASALLRAATADGHRALGWHEAGRIKPGALADLVTIDLESVRLAGSAPPTALEAAVFAASPADVRRVIVGGRELVRDGQHVRLDVAAELRTAIEPLVPGGEG